MIVCVFRANALCIANNPVLRWCYDGMMMQNGIDAGVIIISLIRE